MNASQLLVRTTKIISLGLVLTACRSEDIVVIDPPEWELLLRLPQERAFTLTSAPNGELFLSTSTALYRMVPPQSGNWVKLATTPAPIHDLYAPNGELLFALSNTEQVYAWRPGNGLVREPAPIQSNEEGVRAGLPAALYSIAGTSANNVWVVGDSAIILHFDGARWQRERNPMQAYVDSAAPAVYRSRLQGVAASDETWIIGADPLFKRDDIWHVVQRPLGDNFGGSFNSVVVVNSTKYFGGRRLTEISENAVLIGLQGGKWKSFNDEVEGARSGFFRGKPQPDGSALFWSFTGDVVHVTDSSVQLYQFPQIRELRAVVAANAYLWVAANTDEAALVFRVKLHNSR